MPLASGWGRLLAFGGYLVEPVRRGHGGRGNNDNSCDDAYPRYLVSRIDSNETPHKVAFVRSNTGFRKNIGSLFFGINVRHFAVFGRNDFGTPSKVNPMGSSQVTKLL